MKTSTDNESRQSNYGTAGRTQQTLAAGIGRAVSAIRQWIAGRSSAQSRLELLETLQLGGKRQLMLVVCDGQEYLVGAGSDSVHSIAQARISASEPAALRENGCQCDHEAASLSVVQKRRISL